MSIETAGADTGADADLEAGFAGENTVLTETPEPETAPQPQDQTPQDNQPWYARVTEDQFNDLMSKANSIDQMQAEYRRQMDQAFGKIGNLQQLLQQRQAETPAGQPVEITEEDVADIAAEFPELSGATLKTLQKVAGKLRGTGAGTGFDQAQVENLVQQRIEPLRSDIEEVIETRLLSREHPSWKTDVQSPEFLQWLGTKDQEFQQQLIGSVDSVFIGTALKEFKDAREALQRQQQEAQQKGAKRTERFAAAVNPRGTGGHAQGRTDDDEFEAGFKS